MSIREQLDVLVQMQEIDLKVDQLKNRKAELPIQVKALESNIGNVKKRHTAKTAELTQHEKLASQTLAAIQMNTERLERAGSKADNVHNTKEFQAAQKETDQLKKLLGDLEIQKEKKNAELEGIKEISEIESAVAEEQKKLDAALSEIDTHVQGLDHEIQNFLGERGKVSHKIPPVILARYDRVRAVKAGLGIVPAVTGRCKGCNMMIPPQMYNDLFKAQEFFFCPSCHRVLFLPVVPGEKQEDKS